jgi:hypothetical protein
MLGMGGEVFSCNVRFCQVRASKFRLVQFMSGYI